MNRSTREQGFTLVELLVSLAILAVALGVLFGAISDALDRTRKDRDDALASSLAQSLLARAGIERTLRAEDLNGTYANGMRWHLSIAPYGSAGDAKAWPVTAFLVRATILWTDNSQTHSKTLSTLRLLAPVPSNDE
jgi:prepilin-type N-terminal cleavage/methylation domain-containing protein